MTAICQNLLHRAKDLLSSSQPGLGWIGNDVLNDVELAPRFQNTSHLFHGGWYIRDGAKHLREIRQPCKLLHMLSDMQRSRELYTQRTYQWTLCPGWQKAACFDCVFTKTFKNETICSNSCKLQHMHGPLSLTLEESSRIPCWAKTKKQVKQGVKFHLASTKSLACKASTLEVFGIRSSHVEAQEHPPEYIWQCQRMRFQLEEPLQPQLSSQDTCWEARLYLHWPWHTQTCMGWGLSLWRSAHPSTSQPDSLQCNMKDLADKVFQNTVLNTTSCFWHSTGIP